MKLNDENTTPKSVWMLTSERILLIAQIPRLRLVRSPVLKRRKKGMGSEITRSSTAASMTGSILPLSRRMLMDLVNSKKAATTVQVNRMRVTWPSFPRDASGTT
jgi:hypothetical protein